MAHLVREGGAVAPGAVPVDVVMALLEEAGGEHRDRDDRTQELLTGLPLTDAEAARIEARVRVLRESSRRWRARGRELSALVSSARELVRVRDVDQLLERLVERSHELMGTDVTYLSEFDADSRELRVRTTMGTVAPSFPGLRVPRGMGLASLVVDSRAPRWTSNYPGMTQAPHESGIDEAVADEGLVSLLGVPLLAGEEVIGVLFAANRFEHAFSPEEVSLLSAFADHAAVVLQTARLLARAQQATADTQRAYTQLARHVEAMERASDVHTDLTGLVLRGADAADVAGALGRALRCRVTILDDELLPTTGQGVPDESIREAVASSRGSGRCVTVTGHERAVVVAAMAGQTFLGALLLERGQIELGAVELRTAERAAQITALLSLRREAMVEAEHRLQDDLLADLLSGDPRRTASATERAKARGVRADRPLSVVVLAVTDSQRRRAALRALARVVVPGGLVGEHDGWIVALTALAEPADAARRLHAAVHRALSSSTRTGPNLGVVAVAAPAGEIPGEVHAGFEGAVEVARILPVIGLRDAAVTTDEYLPYVALFRPGERRVAEFVRRMLGPVLDWDAGRGGALLETLSVYLDNRLSPVAAARVLRLHKNTVLQRLDRIAELLGTDWQAPDQLFRLGVAVRVARLRDTDSPDNGT